MKKLLTLIAFGLIALTGYTQNPTQYYHFDMANPLADSMGGSALSNYYSGGYDIITGGPRPQGKALRLSETSKAMRGVNVTTASDILVFEIAIKIGGYNFEQCDLMSRGDGAFSVRIYTDRFRFTAGGDNMEVYFDGINGKSLAYYADGNWHHLVFTYDAPSGLKKIHVDGQLLESKAIAVGTITDAGNLEAWLNTNTTYFKTIAAIDNFAVYNTTLSDSVISKHYHNLMDSLHYSFSTSGDGEAIPSRLYTAPVDTLEFAEGYSSGTYNKSAYEQITKAPDPRYVPVDLGRQRHVNWVALDYFSSYGQPGVNTATMVATSKQINYNLATKWNYYLEVTGNLGSYYNSYTDTTNVAGAQVALANRNASIPTSAICLWNQISPVHIGRLDTYAYSLRKDLSANHYLKNSSGAFIKSNGSVISTDDDKRISPIAPLDCLAVDGQTQRYYLNRLVSALTRPLNYISENDEVLPVDNTNIISMDPAIVAAKNASGLSWFDFQGQKLCNINLNYRNQIMSHPSLSAWGTKFSQYQLSGDTSFDVSWRYARYINDPIVTPFYNDRMGTQDFYPRYPWNWKEGFAAWNGLMRLKRSMKHQIAQGDSLFAPFVGAGWDEVDSINIRPAQWLGLLKIVNGLGACYMHTGFFNELPGTPVNPQTYAYQMMMPSYAQAASRRYPAVINRSHVMDGDMPLDIVSGGTGYTFKSGDPNIVTVVRKMKNTEAYLIYTALQRFDNANGNAPLEKTATISLAGRSLSFKSRLQGSIYIYRNLPGGDTTFIQLDGWHEYKHPNRWSSHIEMEGELPDDANFINYKIKTDQTVSNSAGDFSSFTSYARLEHNSQSRGLKYSFVHPDSTTLYVWVKLAKAHGASQNLKVDINGNGTKTIKVTTDEFTWYGVDLNSADLQWTNVTAQTKNFVRLFGNNNIKIDKLIVTGDSSYVP